MLHLQEPLPAVIPLELKESVKYVVADSVNVWPRTERHDVEP